MIWRVTAAIIAVILIYAFIQFGWHVAFNGSKPAPAAPTVAFTAPPSVLAAPSPVQPGIAAPATLVGCTPAPQFEAAADRNTISLQSAVWSVFGRLETGWEIYEPMTAHEIGAGCPPQISGFAKSLAAWQGAHQLPATGVMDAPTLTALRLVWLHRRTFVGASSTTVCPPPPAPGQLVSAAKDEGYSGKPIQLQPQALAAYRAMTAAARSEVSAIAADKRQLTIFSGYRDPVSDAAACARDGNCGTIAKANCSAHRTGTAMDVYLGSASGYPPESSADPNRLYQSRSPAYRWLAANAARFGFVNYPFEPWHWEWTGAAP